MSKRKSNRQRYAEMRLTWGGEPRAESTPPKIRSWECLIAKKLENPDIELKLNPLMEQKLIPKPLTSIVFVGSTGSGKSNVLITWLTSEYMYKDVFDETYLFSLSGDLDPMFKKLGLKKENIVSQDIISKVSEILQQQKDDIETQGFRDAKLINLVMEDVTGNFKILRHPILVTAFTMGRHLKASIWLVCHKYKSIMPCLRLNAGAVVLFPCNNAERDQIIDDYLPSGVKKNTMKEMIKHAFKRTPKDQRPFFFLDNKNKDTKFQFRKGLYEFLEPQSL